MADDLTNKITGDLDACRSAVHRRLLHENGVTEGEVLAVGTQVDTIVNEAKSHVDDIEAALSGLDEDGSIPDIIEDQSDALSKFLANTRERVERLESLSAEATERCDTITRAGHAISNVARAVKILAINASVEAARLPGASGFSVIAKEMQRLSEAVEASNQQVAGVAERLLEMLPQIGKEAHLLTGESEVFQEILDGHAGDLEERATGLTEAIEACRRAGETRLTRILEASAVAESHLVFQDPVAQRLLRIDKALLLLRTKILTHLEVNPHILADARPPEHEEIGMGRGGTDEMPPSGELILL